MQSPTDRRSTPRAGIYGVATVYLRDKWVKCGMLNVGANGMALSSTAPRPLGSPLHIRFSMPGRFNHLDTDAILVRREKQGQKWFWGVRFKGQQPQVTSEIWRYLQEHHPGLEVPTRAAAGSGTTEGRQNGPAREEGRHGQLENLYKKALHDLFGD